MDSHKKKSEKNLEEVAEQGTDQPSQESSENTSNSTASDSYRVLVLQGGSGVLEQYAPMVRAKWLRSLKHGNDFFDDIDNKTYFTFYAGIINDVLANPLTEIRVAELIESEIPDTAVGFSVFTPPALHFVYVNPEARRQGVATALFPTNVEWITHLTKIGRSIWKKKLPRLKFNPF